MNQTRLRSAYFIFIVFLYVVGACSPEPFDPDQAIRIYYENPMGCDEVSGTIILKASVRGKGAPVPAKMRYVIWTDNESHAFVVEGNAPDYEAPFDTTLVRDGYMRYRAIPLDASDREINIKSPPYNAKGIIPTFKGFMVRNGEIALERPLVVMGAAIEPETGALTEDRFAEQLSSHLVFGASLMTHLGNLGFIPSFCFEDMTTVVLDPTAPSISWNMPPKQPVDLLGREVAGRVTWNSGTICYNNPFFERRVPNGIPDIWELTALDNVLFYQLYGPVPAESVAVRFFDEVITSISSYYHTQGSWFSMFELEQPVPYQEPENILQEKIEQGIRDGATAVLVYDFYNKANEFEMSSGSWPCFQEAIDKANQNLGTSVRLGTIVTNHYQIMQYEEFYEALFSGVRHLVTTTAPAADKRVGIILAAHGSSTTNRLYDVSNIKHNPVMKQRIEDYFKERKQQLHASSPLSLVCYSEYANSTSDGLPGVGEQVKTWIDEHYDYVFIFPMEWPWPTRDIWFELRKNAVELITLDDTAQRQLYVRDSRNRGSVQAGLTTIVFGETIMDQKDENSEAYEKLKDAAVKLLKERMANLTER